MTRSRALHRYHDHRYHVRVTPLGFTRLNMHLGPIGTMFVGTLAFVVFMTVVSLVVAWYMMLALAMGSVTVLRWAHGTETFERAVRRFRRWRAGHRLTGDHRREGGAS